MSNDPEKQMTFEEYQAAVAYAREHNPEWRVGQAAFNVLMLNRPDLSEPIRATLLDPFHCDTEVQCKDFYNWVIENW